jgi:hypothetical protein
MTKDLETAGVWAISETERSAKKAKAARMGTSGVMRIYPYKRYFRRLYSVIDAAEPDLFGEARLYFVLVGLALGSVVAGCVRLGLR